MNVAAHCNANMCLCTVLCRLSTFMCVYIGHKVRSVYVCACKCKTMCDWLQRSVKEESIIIHHNQLLCCSFRTDELLTRSGHGGDENHMRVKYDIYQRGWFLYKTFSTLSQLVRSKHLQNHVLTEEA